MQEEDNSLCFDVSCILQEFTRDRTGDGVLRSDASNKALEVFAATFARRLAPRIGGRYVPKGLRITDDQLMLIRDKKVWSAHTGNNRDEIMRTFRISRSQYYSIMARKPRGR